MNVELKGKVALVTGGARDIGRAVSLKLAECGAAVVVNYFASAEKANDVVAEITKKGGKAIAA
jgi:3-oxoacyl-[acyl-carrier protein] reductase